MSRGAALSLYALLVLIWSSTWVAIKIGLEDAPALLGAGVRFALAGVLLLGFAAARRRSLKTDRLLALILGLLPFAFCYGLVYWGEQYIPSGLTAVLFGVMPLYTAILAAAAAPGRAAAGAGAPRRRARARPGCRSRSPRASSSATSDRAALGAIAVVLSPLGAALGNIALKRRAGELDAIVLNGWGMLIGGGLLLALSGADRGLGRGGVEREGARLDPLPRGRRVGRGVRDADRPAARDVRAGELVHRADDPVRRADLRRAPLRRADHRPRGRGRRARRRRPARRARRARACAGRRCAA